MSTEQHKVCLTWTGGREEICLPADMTLKQLGNAARTLVLGCSGTSSSSSVSEIVLSMGFPAPRPIELDGRLARSVVPHRTRVRVRENKKRTWEQQETANDEQQAESSNSRKRGSPSGEASDVVVDLTGDEDPTRNDEALARRLQQEEEANAARQQAAAVEDEHLPAVNEQLTNNAAPLMTDRRDPTTVMTGEHWIYQHGPEPYRSEAVLGKWLVYHGPSNIYEKWQKIASAVALGELHAAQAKVATGQGKKVYVICVYTSEERMDEVGMRLIRITKQNMSYKTNRATEEGLYSSSANADVKITLKTLYWDNGRPTFDKPKPKKSMHKDESLSKAQKAAKQNPQLTHRFDDRILSVTGLQYYNNVSPHALKDKVTRLRLEREPSNAHDRSAIRADVLLGNEPPKKIGYVEKKQAHVWAPWLDRDLVRIDSAVLDRRDGNSTIAVVLKGRACGDAKQMLGCF